MRLPFFHYNGPEFSDGPFVAIRVLMHSEDGLQIYAERGGPFGYDVDVRPAKSRVNTIGHAWVPVWRLTRSRSCDT
jgi:hypothetical protein